MTESQQLDKEAWDYIRSVAQVKTMTVPAAIKWHAEAKELDAKKMKEGK